MLVYQRVHHWSWEGAIKWNAQDMTMSTFSQCLPLQLLNLCQVLILLSFEFCQGVPSILLGYHSKLPKGWCHGLSDFEWNSGHTSIPQGICQRSCLLRPDMLIFWDLLRPPRWDYWPEIQKSFLCISGPVCQCQYQGASAWLHVATPKAVIGQSKVASSMPISNKYECFIPYS